MICCLKTAGRGLDTQANTHSLMCDHHVFLNLETLKFYCLPDNYEIIDTSLEDITVSSAHPGALLARGSACALGGGFIAHSVAVFETRANSASRCGWRVHTVLLAAVIFEGDCRFNRQGYLHIPGSGRHCLYSIGSGYHGCLLFCLQKDLTPEGLEGQIFKAPFYVGISITETRLKS